MANIKITIKVYDADCEDYVIASQENIATAGLPAEVVFSIANGEAFISDGFIHTNDLGDGDVLEDTLHYSDFDKAEVVVSHISKIGYGTESWFKQMSLEGETVTRINEYLNENIIGHEDDLVHKALA